MDEIHYLEDFRVGQTWRSATVDVGTEDILAFAARFDPQPFHLDPEAAKDTLFQGLAASGWHTAALTMRLLVGCGMNPAGGLVGAGVDELRWPLPVRPGDSLRVEVEILEIRPSRSKPDRGILRVAMRTLNQHDQLVQSGIASVVATARPA